jgi:hypothetical protein
MNRTRLESAGSKFEEKLESNDSLPVALLHGRLDEGFFPIRELIGMSKIGDDFSTRAVDETTCRLCRCTREFAKISSSHPSTRGIRRGIRHGQKIHVPIERSTYATS